MVVKHAYMKEAPKTATAATQQRTHEEQERKN